MVNFHMVVNLRKKPLISQTQKDSTFQQYPEPFPPPSSLPPSLPTSPFPPLPKYVGYMVLPGHMRRYTVG